jgi:hypothetical protein
MSDHSKDAEEQRAAIREELADERERGERS